MIMNALILPDNAVQSSKIPLGELMKSVSQEIDRVEKQDPSPNKVTKFMGSGGFGNTYRVSLKGKGVTLNNRPLNYCVVKRQKRRSRAIQADFFREVNALSNLNGFRGIVQLIHFDFQIGEIMLEPGTINLNEYALKQSKTPETRHLFVKSMPSLFYKICAAIFTIHAMGMEHNDIKPLNMIMGEDGEPKIIDFGLTTMFPYQDITRSDQPATTAYRSVEHFVTNIKIFNETGVFRMSYVPRTPFQSDIWALAVSFLDMLIPNENALREEARTRGEDTTRSNISDFFFYTPIPASVSDVWHQKLGETMSAYYNFLATQMSIFGKETVLETFGDEWFNTGNFQTYFNIVQDIRRNRLKTTRGIREYMMEQFLFLRTEFKETLEASELFSLIESMLVIDPTKRNSMRDVMDHPYFGATRKSEPLIRHEAIRIQCKERLDRFQYEDRLSIQRVQQDDVSYESELEKGIAAALYHETRYFRRFMERDTRPWFAMRAYFTSLYRKIVYRLVESKEFDFDSHRFGQDVAQSCLLIVQVLFVGRIFPRMYDMAQRMYPIDKTFVNTLNKIIVLVNGNVRCTTIYDYIDVRCPRENDLKQVLSAAYLCELTGVYGNDHPRILFSALRLVNNPPKLSVPKRKSSQLTVIKKIYLALGIDEFEDMETDDWKRMIFDRLKDVIFPIDTDTHRGKPKTFTNIPSSEFAWLFKPKDIHVFLDSSGNELLRVGPKKVCTLEIPKTHAVGSSISYVQYESKDPYLFRLRRRYMQSYLKNLHALFEKSGWRAFENFSKRVLEMDPEANTDSLIELFDNLSNV